MSRRSQRSPFRGFVLIAVLLLLGLVAALLVSLAAVVRVEGQVMSRRAQANDARSHAKLAFQIALGQLQRYAGPDDRLTTTGGTDAVHPLWCGVWSADTGSPQALTWLVSGNEHEPLSYDPDVPLEEPAAAPAGPTVWLLNRRLPVALAAERVRVPKVEVRGLLPGGAERTVTGRFAYWVSDEGGKVSLNPSLPNGEVAAVGYPEPRLEALFAAVPAVGPRTQIVMTDQAAQAGFSASAVTQRWLDVTSRACGVRGAELVPAAVNVNTVRAAVSWRAILSAAESGLPEELRASGADLDEFYAGAASAIAAGGRPFVALDDFAAALAPAFPEGVPVEPYLDQLHPLLAVRSDTFLIRAYGEAVSPATGDVVGIAFLEARVQRSTELHPEPLFGRTFVVEYLRWLDPSEI